MPLPLTIDDKVRKQFVRILNRASGAKDDGEEFFNQLRIELFAIMDLIDAKSTYFQRVRDEIHLLNPRSCSRLIAYVKALDESYRAGIFEDAVHAYEAEVATDYMTQAENLMSGVETAQFSHVPAAMLAGAILEIRLRDLCRRQTPTISLLRSSYQKKTLGDFIDDLKRAGIYNEIKEKQLRAWADIRNAAAHGEFKKFSRQEVEFMIAGVKTFLADYL